MATKKTKRKFRLGYEISIDFDTHQRGAERFRKMLVEVGGEPSDDESTPGFVNLVWRRMDRKRASLLAVNLVQEACAFPGVQFNLFLYRNLF